MRTYFAIAAALALTLVLQATAAVDAEAITAALKSFKFKVPEGQAHLFGHNEEESTLFFRTNGRAEATIAIPADGEHEILVKAGCDSALNERAKFKLSIDGKATGKETLLTNDEPREYKFTAKLPAGKRTLAIEFTNDVYKEGEYDRNLYIHAVTLKRLK